MPSAKDKDDKDGKEKATRAKLSLKGSAKTVSEFFEYSINSILYQRGVYPPEDFTPVKKYGLNMLVTSDDQVRAYLKRILGQLGKWMAGSKISRLVVVISGKESGEDVERWQFDVDVTSPPSSSSTAASSGASKPSKSKPPSSSSTATATAPAPAQAKENAAAATAADTETRTEAQIQAEIQALFRQVTASVTFLPTLAEQCTFNVLVYADADSDVPIEWGDSSARDIEGAERVVLRGFSTGEHRVGTSVSYRLGE